VTALDPALSASSDRPGGRIRLPSAVTLWFVVGMLIAPFLFLYMPVRLLAVSRQACRDGGTAILAWAPAVLAVSSCLVALRWVFLYVCSFLQYRRNEQSCRSRNGPWPLVSILVPAYNEGKTVVDSLRSLLRQDYPSYEIVFVDDGSTDDTLTLARTLEGDHGRCRLRVFHKPNGGKSSALNYAFLRSVGELVLCMDADSRLESDCLRWMVGPLADPAVVAVAGQVRVRNRRNLTTRLQALEYLLGNGAVRMSQSLFGSVLVVAGALGLFRRGALEEVFLRNGRGPVGAETAHTPGPWEHDTLAEDFDLSLTLLSLGGRVVYQPRAVSQTEAPAEPLALISQRYRWMRGTIQALRKYAHRLRRDPARRHARPLAWVCASYVYDLILQPLLMACTITALAVSILHGQSAASAGWFLLGFGALNATLGAFYVAMHRDRASLLHVLPFYDIYQNILLPSATAIAIIDEFRHAGMRWR